jgi:hypothetical protein
MTTNTSTVSVSGFKSLHWHLTDPFRMALTCYGTHTAVIHTPKSFLWSVTNHNTYFSVDVSTCMDAVTDQLYISDIDTARNTSLQQFDAIVTTCQDDIEDHVPDGCDYSFFNMADDEASAETYGGSYEYSTFYRAAETIYCHLENDDVTLVHCHVGANRSVSTAAAALARHNDWDVSQAYNAIYDVRDIIAPNDTMLGHAIKYNSHSV